MCLIYVKSVQSIIKCLTAKFLLQLMEDTNTLTEAPVGKPAKKTEQLKEDSLGAVYSSDDSYTSAAAKVGSIVLGASVITWFGVPLLVFVVRLFIPSD